jgi:hypothetical protein
MSLGVAVVAPCGQVAVLADGYGEAFFTGSLLWMGGFGGGRMFWIRWSGATKLMFVWLLYSELFQASGVGRRNIHGAFIMRDVEKRS